MADICFFLAILFAAPGEPVKRDGVEGFYAERRERGLPSRYPALQFGDRMKVGHVGVVLSGVTPGEHVPFCDVRVQQVLANGILAEVSVYKPVQQFSSTGADARPRGIKHEMRQSVRVAIKDIATDGLVDGKRVRLPGAFEVAETKTFETVGGGSLTTFVLVPTELPKPPPTPPKAAKTDKTKPSEELAHRTWQDATGKYKVKAAFVTFENNEVVLRCEDGRVIRLAASRLSKGDQKYFRDEMRKRRNENN